MTAVPRNNQATPAPPVKTRVTPPHGDPDAPNFAWIDETGCLHDACPDCAHVERDGAETPELGVRCSLCAVCALHVIRGHTRWKSLVCGTCRTRVQRFSTMLNVFIPVGIHSMMNGITLTTTDVQATDMTDVAAFSERLAESFKSIGKMNHYGTTLVHDRNQRFGLRDPKVELDRYLTACDEAGITELTAWRDFEIAMLGGATILDAEQSIPIDDHSLDAHNSNEPRSTS